MRARAVVLHSMPVPVMMPSLIAACGSPKKTSPSSTKTGDRPDFPRLRLSGSGMRPPNQARPLLKDRALERPTIAQGGAVHFVGAGPSIKFNR